MPRVEPGTVKRRTAAELATHRATLTPRRNGCGHVAINAGDYYLKLDKRCVDCYREAERERQRAYRLAAGARGDLERLALNFVGHASRANVGNDSSDAESAARRLLRELRESRARQGYVYLVIERPRVPKARSGRVGLIVRPYLAKIGFSIDPRARVGELQTGNGRPLALAATRKGTRADERRLHRRFIAHNTVGEWFAGDAVPALLDYFGVTDDDLKRLAVAA